MLTLISLRKALVAFVAFIAVSLIFIHSSSSRYQIPFNSLNDSPFGFKEPQDGKFHWSQVRQRYPVESLIPMPSGGSKIPRIQHHFHPESEQAHQIRLARLEEIKAEFVHAWTGYKDHAWRSDEVAPISGGSRNTFGGWAATLVDSLDTLWIMGLYDDFTAAISAIDAIDFSTSTLSELDVFETTIRHLGGFLAAHDLTHGAYPSLLQKAWELGTMLYAAFDTPNRMPALRWNFANAATRRPKPQEASNGALSAELGSLTLEFTRLARLTGDGRFFDAVQRITDVVAAQQNATKLPGMWPVVVDAKRLDFTGFNGFTIGGMANSLYEYLPKQHALLGGATQQYRTLFEKAARAMKTHLFYRPMTRGNADILVPGDVLTDQSGGFHMEPKNQHSTCFAGGMFAMAGKMFDRPEDVEVGRKLTEGCLWAYETSPNGVMPEVMHTLPCEDARGCRWDEGRWRDAVVKAHSEDGQQVSDATDLIREKHLREGVTKVADSRYILRPEAIESIFILYRITGDEALRERAWLMFRNIIRLTKTPIAHAGLDDCVADDPPKSDRMESFWTAETLKYFYLLFSDPNVVSLDEYVLNTEAHPLRRPV